MIVVLRIFAFLAGLLLIAWSVLLYETEERQIDDTLARWWIEVDDAAKRTSERALRHLQIAARAVAAWLSQVFGDKLISGRAVAASVVLSLSSLALFVFTLTAAGETWRFNVGIVCLSAILFYVAVTPRLALCRDLIAITAAIYLGRGVYMIYGVLFTNEFPGWSVLDVIVILAGSLGGVASDFVLTVVTRRILRSIATAQTLMRGLMAFATTSTIGLVFTIIPLFVWLKGPRPPTRWMASIGFAAATNIYGCIISLALAILLSGIAVQRALWSGLQRPLYAIWRFKVFQDRKLLFYAGSVLVVIAVPGSLDVLKTAETLFK